ncbi:MAG: LacI family transcriptional regulator [Spartobacteria bacterium]|nr:LacI family transcriptional regulator [Spartobacteria bacterium]
MAEQNGKRLTMWQIAELANTSKSTVSRVLSNDPHVSEETRKRVAQVVEEHGFRPNLFARGLRGGRTGQIAVIGRWMEEGFLANVIKGMDLVAHNHDAHLLVCLAHSSEDYVNLWERFADGGQVDGCILVAPPRELLNERVASHHVPAVLCACQAPQSRKGWKQVDSVVLDNVRAIDELMELLVNKGCRQFVYLKGTGDTYDAWERNEAFDAYITRHDELSADVIKGAEWRDSARELVLQYLEGRTGLPDAFVCFNDVVAFGVLEALRSRHIRVPDDVRVTGFDDTTTADFISMTTVHVPSVLIGQETAKLLFLRLESDEETRIARNTVIELTIKYRDSA